MDYDIKALVNEALAAGFTHAGELNVASLVFMPEVREMCNDTCTQYDNNWRCPPGCASLEEGAAQVAQYSHGVIVQTTGHLEDNFDFETIGDTYKKHVEDFGALVKDLRQHYPDALFMSSDSCKLCEKCTYPDAGCRFPELAISPIEAYGLVVNKLCESSEMPYYYGKLTITYTSAYLLK